MFSIKYKFSGLAKYSTSERSRAAYMPFGITDELIYCGMSGREIEKNRHKKKYGLVTRLASHASGRLSGDQFCVYVANRCVIPSLTLSDLPKFANGELKLDYLNQKIHP